MPVTVQSTPVKVNVYVSGGNVSSVLVNPMTNAGDMIYGGISGSPLRLGIGSTNQVLTVVSGNPTWVTPTPIAVPLTTNHIFVGNGSNAATDVAMSGDASILASGALTVLGLKGSLLPALSQGLLQYNGTNWVFNSIYPNGSFTTGSVIFMGASQLSQDNNNFFWNSGSHILSVNTGGDQTGTDSINVYDEIDAYNPNSLQGGVGSGTESGYTFSSSRGTGGSPIISNSGDLLGGISGWAYTGAVPSYQAIGGMWVNTQGVGTTLGGKLSFYTRADGGSLTQRLTIDNTGLTSFAGRILTTQTTTLAPINFPGFATDPSVPTEGDVAYNLTSHVLKFYNGTTWVSMSGGGGGTPGGSNTQLQYNNAGAFGGTSATYSNVTGTVTFTPTTTNSGLNIGTFAGDPSTTAVGDLWYNSSTNSYKVKTSAVGVLPNWTSGLSSTRIPFSTGVSGDINGNPLLTYNNGTSIFATAGATFTPPAKASAWTSAIVVNGAANTAYTTATEFIDIDFNLARSVTWIDGTVATQRFAYFRGATVNKTTTSATFTDIFTQYTDVATAGAGVTFTRSWAAGFNGNVWSSGQVMVAPSGTAFVGNEFISAQGSQNSNIGVVIKNSIATGTASYGSFQVIDQAGKTLSMGQVGNGFTSSNIDVANTTVIKSSSGTGFNIGLTSNVPLAFWTANVERARFLGQGQFLHGYTTQASSEVFGVQKNQSAQTQVAFTNTTSGSTARISVIVSTDSALANNISLHGVSAGWTPASGLLVASTGVLLSSFTGGLNIGTNGTAQVSLWTNNTQRQTIDANGNFTLSQGVQTGTVPAALIVIPAANTSLTAATESIDVDFQFNRSEQWAAGTTATQRQMYVRGVTLTGVAATATFTDAYSFYVDPPIVGANAAISNIWAAGFAGNVLLNLSGAGKLVSRGGGLSMGSSDGQNLTFITNNTNRLVCSGAGGNIGTWTFSGSPTAVGGVPTWITFTQSANASTAVTKGLIWTGAAHTGQSVSSELIDINWNLARTIQFISNVGFSTIRAFLIQSPTYSFVTSGGGAITDAATAAITGAPAQSTNAAITNTHALLIQSAAVGSATNSFGLTANAQTGATNNYSAQFLGGLGVIFNQSPQSVSHTFINITQSAHTGGTPTGILWTGGAHTALVASVETNDFWINSNRTIQFSTGSLLFQRTSVFSGPTISFVGASTVTNAATLGISQATNAGTNATITNTHGILIGNSGWSVSGTITNSYGLTVYGMTGATNNYAAQFLGNTTVNITARNNSTISGFSVSGNNDTNLPSGTEVNDISFTLTRQVSWATGALALQRAFLISPPTYAFAGASTLTDAATVGIGGAPSTGTNATFTNTHGLLISSSSVNAVSTPTNSYGATINAMTGATNNYSAQFIGGIGVKMDKLRAAQSGTTTIAAGTGAGTSPTLVTVTGGDLGGYISITTGTTPTASATVATITFSSTYGTAPRTVNLTPANAATAALSAAAKAYIDQASITATTFVMKSGATNLTASTAYQWFYQVIQ